MRHLHVMRLRLFEPLPVGTITVDGTTSFRYLESYLKHPDAVPLSASLPLRPAPYDEQELLPYFEGLLPEGEARAALAGELNIRLDDYVSILATCGRECIGDVLISENLTESVSGSYEQIDALSFSELFLSDSTVAAQNSASRLSLAGTQTKTGLAHLPGLSMNEGWLKPKGHAATTHILKTSHIRDVPEIEYLCMTSAQKCGISAATVSLIDAARPVLAVERFDRSVTFSENKLLVARKHQEDLAQAFGINPSLKYAEIEGGSTRAIAEFIKKQSPKPARDLAAFAQRLCFNYLIGNCDAHLKNYSLISESSSVSRDLISLAPAYDFVCTTFFERFSREMAMEFGGAKQIDDVTPESFRALANDLGITQSALRNLIKHMPGQIKTALSQCAEGMHGNVLESTPFIAEDLLEDMVPRFEIAEAFCTQA